MKNRTINAGRKQIIAAAIKIFFQLSSMNEMYRYMHTYRYIHISTTHAGFRLNAFSSLGTEQKNAGISAAADRAPSLCDSLPY